MMRYRTAVQDEGSNFLILSPRRFAQYTRRPSSLRSGVHKMPNSGSGCAIDE